MNKHIDSEAFFKVINTLPYKDTSYPDASAYNGAISDVADMLAHFPAADVQEVRHGRWVVKSDYPKKAECSACGYPIENELVCWWDYCPNCGAKMDKEENE